MNMMFYSQENRETSRSVAPSSQVAVIRRELVELTGDHFSAVILNQLLYWTQRVKDFDLLLEEERSFNQNGNVSPCHGWIYKTANELIEETMLCISRFTMRRYLGFLVEQGWVYEKLGPTEKWNKTTHYRLNLRKIQTDLQALGYNSFEAFGQHIPALNEMQVLSKEQCATSEEHVALSDVENCSFESAPLQQDHFAPSEEQSALSVLELNSSNVQIAPSREHIALSNVENCSFEGAPANIRESKTEHSNVENCSFIYLNREYTENTDREHTQRTRAREESKFSDLLEKSPNETVLQTMVKIWQRQINNEEFYFTKKRKRLLKAVLELYFDNNLPKWEDFCLRIKAASFLMGGGPRKWKATLDWILEEANLIKVLEGNFDDPEMAGVFSEKSVFHAERTQKTQAVLSSIKDPIWREWCSQLAKGVPLTEERMLHESLSLSELTQIANARFIECEDNRLIWIGSPDTEVLKAIENLRLQISWVYAKEYPKARTIRTRLDSEQHPVFLPVSPQPIPQGDSQHD